MRIDGRRKVLTQDMTDRPSLVDTDWVEAHLSDPHVRVIEIDRNDLEPYRSGHIPGAIGWNWKSTLWEPRMREFPSPQVFAERLGRAGVTHDTTVVLCGVPVQFGTYGWWVFKYLGHRDVRLLNCGMTRWMQEGRPLSMDVPDVTPTEYAPNPVNAHIRAGRDEVLRALDAPGTAIIDHRSIEEYIGDRVAPPGMDDVGAERYGRIPGALHLPYTALLNADDTFRTPEELRAVVQSVLNDPEAAAISYCRLSHRATLAYFVMTELLGYRNLRVYDGSWTEWGSMVGMPIEV